MAPGKASSLFNKLLSFFLILLLYFGCFVFTTTGAAPEDYDDGECHDNNKNRRSKKRKLSPVISSSWSFLKGIFATKSCKTSIQTQPSTPPRTSQHSISSLVLPEKITADPHLSDAVIPGKITPPPRPLESDISSVSAAFVNNDSIFFPLRNDIFPCTACGEIFQKPQTLENHQSVKHAVSELLDGDSGNNIVRIIFKTGWTDPQKSPIVHRILKIHNSAKILSRFEEYREAVKAKAARNGAVQKREERCIADGNELLRFHCSTFLCDLGQNGNSSICNHQYCSVCGIIKSGFSPKLDGISTLSSSWRAHLAIPEEIEEDFGFMNVKRALLVCRVVAGRVGSESDEVDKEDGGFDSVYGRGGTGVHTRMDEEELLVFNPRAVLPCFVIVYNV